MLFKPHSKPQEKVIFSEKKIVIAATGIQWGKTMSGVIWLKMMIHKFPEPENNFIIASPSFPILTQSTMPPFLRAMEGLGYHDKKNNCFILHGGPTIWFRTGTNPDSSVGITNVRGILCDEAGLYSLYFWEVLQGRASFKEADIRIVTSPYSLNWLYKDYIRKVHKGDKEVMKDVELIQQTSKDNPYFPDKEYERKKKTMDPRRFNMQYGGQFDKMEGLVYDCFDEDENICLPVTLPPGTKFFGGIDWGYNDPFVLLVRAITPDGRHYQVFEHYKSGMTIAGMIDVALRAKKLWPVERFYADPSRPEYIQEFNKNKLVCVGANNEIRLGVDKHYELIKTRRYKIFTNCGRYTINELEMYHYPEFKDVNPNQDRKDQLPVKQNDHTMDVNRYITIATFDINHVKSGNKRLSDPLKQAKEEKRLDEYLKSILKPALKGVEHWS